MVETQAEPIGGYQKFFNQIYAELKFPTCLKESGKVFISFEVDTVGDINNIKSVKSYSKVAGEAACSSIKSLNLKFKPAEQRGRKVKSHMIIPIVFKLEN